MTTNLTINEVRELANAYARTGFIPQLNADEAFCVMMAGIEAGIPPMTAIKQIKVVKGQIGIYSEGMRSLILSHGHKLEWGKCDDTVATITGYRKESPETGHTVTFTIKDAERANLIRRSRDGKPGNWELRPGIMLKSRATTQLGRELFPDVISGLSYAPDELEEIAGYQQEDGLEKKPKPKRKTPVSVKSDENQKWKETINYWHIVLDEIVSLDEDAGKKAWDLFTSKYGESVEQYAKSKDFSSKITNQLAGWLKKAKEKYASGSEEETPETDSPPGPVEEQSLLEAGEDK